MKKIAVIGCGAIADSFHLPALKRLEGGSLEIVLVDANPERAAELGAKHGLGRQARSHREVLDDVDAAVVATPHHTHVPIARDLVEAGVAVLSEKPLGTSVAEVEALRDLAMEKGVTVAVNQTRRFIPACRKIREVLEEGRLGKALSVSVSEGDRFDWPAATPSMFGARADGRGVLLDIGAHVLDLMTWWFGPDLQVVDYHDDSFGGSEASVSCVLEGPACRIEVRLSWLQKQRNAYRISGEGGALTWGVYDLDEVRIEGPDGTDGRAIRLPDAPRSFQDLAPAVLGDFLDAARNGTAPTAGPDDVLSSMRLMEECYGRRRRFDMPWHEFHMEQVHG